MKILALDPATRCGWAHSSGGGGIWDLHTRADESRGMRLLRLHSKLNAVYDSAGVDLVVFEAARNLRYGNAVRVAAQLQAIIELWCQEREVPYRGYSPSEIKKFATGKGSASKEAMLAAARQRWPHIEFEDDNHADAMWLLALAENEYADVSLPASGGSTSRACMPLCKLEDEHE